MLVKGPVTTSSMLAGHGMCPHVLGRDAWGVIKSQSVSYPCYPCYHPLAESPELGESEPHASRSGLEGVNRTLTFAAGLVGCLMIASVFL